MEDNGSRWRCIRRLLIPSRPKSTFRFIRTLALFDARPRVGPSEDSAEFGSAARDGRAAAGAFVRVPLGGDDGYRDGEVVQFAKRVWIHSAARWWRQRRVRPHLRG